MYTFDYFSFLKSKINSTNSLSWNIKIKIKRNQLLLKLHMQQGQSTLLQKDIKACLEQGVLECKKA